MRRTAVIACAIFGLAAVPAGAATTPSGGASNVVIANTTAGATTAERASLQIALDAAPTAASSNLALVTATNCTGCRTVAAALQVIVVAGAPSTFAPANAAIVVNDGCTGCTSYGYARQDVFQASGPVHLTADGQMQIAALRAQMDGVATSGLPPVDLTTQLDALADQLDAVVQHELVLAGAHGSVTLNRAVQAAG